MRAEDRLSPEAWGTSKSRNPREIALASHRDYYRAGTYDDNRLKWTIENFLSGANLSKVLEVGCGDGALLRLLVLRGVDAIGVDASSSGVERCRARGLHAECLDVSTDCLPFADHKFDAVISLETFEHLMNPHYALQEVRRVLRPGGRFLCSVPNPLTGHPYLYPGLFEYKNFRRFLEQSGFAIERVAPWQWPRGKRFCLSRCARSRCCAVASWREASEDSSKRRGLPPARSPLSATGYGPLTVEMIRQDKPTFLKMFRPRLGQAAIPIHHCEISASCASSVPVV